MDLHRTGNKSDWAKRPQTQWNVWQKIAAATNGVVTVGNICTIIGFFLVLVGLYFVLERTYGWGIAAIAIGRMFDIADGWAANATGTKSPLGEQLDAGIDKLETVLTVVVLVVAGIVPLQAAILVAIPQLAIMAFSYTAVRAGDAFHPEQSGKISMTLAWVALVGFGSATTINYHPGTLRMVAYIAVLVSVLFGAYAAKSYYRQMRSRSRR